MPEIQPSFALDRVSRYVSRLKVREQPSPSSSPIGCAYASPTSQVSSPAMSHRRSSILKIFRRCSVLLVSLVRCKYKHLPPERTSQRLKEPLIRVGSPIAMSLSEPCS